MLRIVLAVVLVCLLSACGGDGSSESTVSGQSAAQQFAASVGRKAESSDIDPSVFTRKRATSVALAQAAAAVPPDTTTQLFSLGESKYAVYFPNHEADRSVPGFFYRFYPATGAYLIVDESSRIYVMGGPFGALVTYVGKVEDFIKPPVEPTEPTEPTGPVCKSVLTGFDVTRLDQPPVVISPGGDGAGGPGDGAGTGSAEGAIRGADVNLYDAGGKLLGTAVSDDKGLVRLKACGAAGPFLIEFVGNDRARYFDEGIALRDNSDAQAWAPFPTGEKLSAYVENLTDHHIVVTVMTHIAARQVQEESTGGLRAARAKALAAGASQSSLTDKIAAAPITLSAIRAANEKARATFNQRFAGTGVAIENITRIPSLAFSLDSLRSFGANARGQYAQVLTALAKSAAQFNPTLPNPAREMTKQLTRDLSDGKIDGKDSAGAPVAPTPEARAYEPTLLTTSVAAQTAGRLTVAQTGQGSISVSSSTLPVACGNGLGTCYPFGAVITLTAQPAAGSELRSWSSPCNTTPVRSTCSVTMSGDKAVTANFGPPTTTPVAALKLTISGPGGSVSSQPAGISCPADCAEDYAVGTVVVLRATPAQGNSFVGWSDAACPGTGDCTLTMSAARNVTATFAAPTAATLTVTRAGDGSGIVSSTTADISCGSTCSKSYSPGTQVSLSATPLGGSMFAGWSGACSGQGACTLTMDASKSVTATFTNLPQFTLSATVVGGGTIVSSPAGISCGSGSCTAGFASGTTVSMLATAASGQTFTGWSGDCTGTGVCSVTMSAARNVTANFSPVGVILSVQRAGTGSGSVTSALNDINCGAVCSALFAVNSQVTLTARPATGSVFSGWSGPCAGVGSCVVTADVAKTVTATFTAVSSYVLSVVTSGQGSVTSTPAGISCVNNDGSCATSFVSGTIVTLTATPGSGRTFAGWSGDCTGTGSCIVTMSAARSVTANFSGSGVTLSIVRSGTGSGVVTSLLGDINCGSVCSASFPVNNQVTLIPKAAVGSTFTGWSGGGCTGLGNCVVTMDAAKAVTAIFSINANSFVLTVRATGYGVVYSTPAGIECANATCSAAFPIGTVVSLEGWEDVVCGNNTCVPASTFGGWSGDCTGNTCTLIMSSNRSVATTFITSTR